MATIAQGSITLTNVNDAYTVSVTPNACVIKANFDGSNPDLSGAYCTITVIRDNAPVRFDVGDITTSNSGINYVVGTSTASLPSKTVRLTSIPNTTDSGTISIPISTQDGFTTTVNFQYSVVRESTMLDWIQDWETNKTTIGNTYLITPKLFVGKKITEGTDSTALTGVYIGPDKTSAGIYGLKDGEDIFHINENGGQIAGWEITKDGIQTTDKTLVISSNGTITSKPSLNTTAWQLDKSGEVSFANGKVQFHANGNAEFEGTITATGGKIGGWDISSTALQSDNLYFNNTYIGIAAFGAPKNCGRDDHYASITNYGGVAMHFTSPTNYGMVAYRAATYVGNTQQKHVTFQLGSTNQIAGWSFDDNVLYTGTKATQIGFTSSAGSITISPSALMGYKWYLSSDGSGELAGGAITWDAEGNATYGGTLRQTQNNWELKQDGSGQLANNKISWKADGTLTIDGSVTIAGADGVSSPLINAEGIIAGKVNADNITTGTLSAVDIKQKEGAWELNQSGDGKLANGNISWNSIGELTLKGAVRFHTMAESDFKNNATIYSSASLCYLPATNIPKILELSLTNKDIGKVVRFYNTGAFGQSKYEIQLYSFKIYGEEVLSTGGATVSIAPQETVELTCFELPVSTDSNGNTCDYAGEWVITNRFGTDNFKQSNATGRFTRMIALGKLEFLSNGGYNINGKWYNGKNIDDMMALTRNANGAITLTLKSGSFPTQDYYVIATGYGQDHIKATVLSSSTTSFTIQLSNNTGATSGTCSFMVLDFNWWSNLT